MANKAGEGTGALEKALDVLEVIGQVPSGLSQSELADRLQLPRTTVYRLLATLISRGLLRRDPLRKVYCLGFRCFEMARQAYAMPDLAAAAAVEIRLLRDLTGETSYLAVLDGLDVLSLDRCDGAHSQRSSAILGQRKPVYCTSQGKAILSALGPQERESIVRDLALKALTPHTITNRRRLQAELDISASRGYAVDDEEIVLGVRCVGAPIVDSQGQVRGAISVAGPAYRLTRTRLDLLGPEVAEAARRIGAQLQSTSAHIDDVAIRPVAGRWAFHGNFVEWNAKADRLYWADVLAPAIHVTEISSAGVAEDRELLQLDSPVTGMLVRRDSLLLLQEQGACTLSMDAEERTPIPWPAGVVQALCEDADANVWCAMETVGGSAVGRVGPDGRLDVKWHVTERLQNLQWHTGEQTFFAIAPDSGSILVLHPGQQTIRRLATIPKGSGYISGLAFDAQGGVWTALRDGWSVIRLTSDGATDYVIGLPVPCPTDLTFSKDGNKLYVVTARQSVALDTLISAPLSGRLFELTV